jgi:hypothetical protein
MIGRIDIRALLLGGLAGWGLSYLLSLTSSISLAQYFLHQGSDLAEVAQRMSGSTSILLLFIAMSLASALFGGWAAAALAGQHHMAHGVAVGIFFMATGLITYLSPFPHAMPFWQALITLFLTLPLAMVGAVLARRGYHPDGYPA